MNKVEELEKEKVKIMEEIATIREKEIREKIVPRFKAMKGMCFVYRNCCYSCPKTKSDYWDVFRKIIDFVIEKEGHLHFIIEEFSIDSYGRLNLGIESVWPYHDDREGVFSGYSEITEKEYGRELGKFHKEYKIQTKLRRKTINNK